MRQMRARRQCLEDSKAVKVMHLNFRKFAFASADLIWFAFA